MVAHCLNEGDGGQASARVTTVDGVRRERRNRESLRPYLQVHT
jgi:hypothetical protein